MKYVIGFVVGILIAAGISMTLGAARGPQPTTSFANVDALSKWMHYYYQHREFARIGDAMATASAAGVLKQAPRAMMIGAFLAGVIEADPGALDKLVERLKTASGDQQVVLALAVALAGRKDLFPRIKRDLPAVAQVADRLLPDENAGHVLLAPVERSPLGLDLQWAYFMATGKEEPVLRIISALPGLTDKESLERMISAYAARWSLSSNAGLHPKVMEICRRAAAVEPEPVAGILREIITAAESRDHVRLRREGEDAARAWKARHEEKKG
jgi:hypothetical protein